MAVKTGVDIVTQILDQTAAGASSVERSLKGMEGRIESSSIAAGKRAGGGLLQGIGSVFAAGAALNMVDGILEKAFDARKAGQNIGLALADGLAESLRSLPVVGKLGEAITWIGGDLPGTRSAATEEGMRSTQEMQQRQRKQQELDKKDEDARRRVLEEHREREERLAEQRRQDLEKRQAEEERQREQLARQLEQQRLEREREDRQMEQERQREADRVASEQRRRDDAVQGAEGRLAGVTDSRGSTGRAAAFLQNRSTVQIASDTLGAIKSLIEINRKQLEAMEQTRFEVVGP